MSNTELTQLVINARSQAPKAWVKVDAALGPAFLNRNFTASQLAVARRLLNALATAAKTANFDGFESPEHAAWRAALAEAAALMTKVDGGGDATEAGLRARQTAAAASASLSGARKALAAQLVVPPEPKADAAFADALGALQLFLGS